MAYEEQQEHTGTAQKYLEVPFEVEPLYKKYFVNMDLKDFESKLVKHDMLDGYDENILKPIYAVTGIKFDAVIYNGAIAKGSPQLNEIEGKKAEMIKSAMPLDRLIAFSNDFPSENIGIDIQKPVVINMLFYNNGKYSLPSNMFFEVGKGVNATVNEFFVSGENAENSLNASVQVFNVGEGANIEINEMHCESEHSTVLVTRSMKTDDNAHVDFNAFYTGGIASRNRSIFNNSGYGSVINSNEAVVGTGSQKFDLNTRMTNLKSKSVCNYDIRTVLADSSYGIVKSFAKMLKDAEGSESHINERGLIYDKNARISMMPDMSIDESFVKASHSSSTSPIPEEDIFYLSSRGVDKDMARFLVGSGLIYESLKKIKNSEARTFAMRMAHYRLESRRIGLPEINELKNYGVWYE